MTTSRRIPSAAELRSSLPPDEREWYYAQEILSALEAREKEAEHLNRGLLLITQANESLSKNLTLLREKARAVVAWSESKDACRPRSRCLGRRAVMDALTAELPPPEGASRE